MEQVPVVEEVVVVFPDEEVGAAKLAATVSPSWVVTEATTPAIGAWIRA